MTFHDPILPYLLYLSHLSNLESFISKETRDTIKYILHFIEDKRSFAFWFFIRILSVLIPPVSIYLFSRVIKCLETNCDFQRILFLIIITFISYIIDNFLRLLSIHQLQYLINKSESDIQLFFVRSLHAQRKRDRHQAIQSIRNFSEAARLTMEYIKQPGIDGFVSLFYLPLIIFFLDFKVFIFEIAYILIYYFADIYTTEVYSKIKEVQNKRLETYYAKLQDTNDVAFETTLLNKEYLHLTYWGFWEWFSLQNIAVTFFTIVFAYLVIEVYKGQKHISDIFLIASYLTSTQVFLNSISQVKDGLANTKVALSRLSQSKSCSVDFSDLT